MTALSLSRMTIVAIIARLLEVFLIDSMATVFFVIVIMMETNTIVATTLLEIIFILREQASRLALFLRDFHG